ncbi:MAG TPA: hypothetical protein VHK27_12765 [Gammaproteobacteria bacterium]|nr:hypothetical protein [Gammaproteobacteria bacterium]
MAAREAFKNLRQARRRFAVRALVAAFGTLLLLALIAGRMAFLQLVNHDLFQDFIARKPRKTGGATAAARLYLRS